MHHPSPARPPVDAAGWRLVPPESRHAVLIAGWSASAEEAAAWVSLPEHPFPAATVAAWWQQPDAQPWLLLDPDGAAVAYGELWDDEEEDEIELARLIVSPQHRRQGVGRRLVQHLVARARASARSTCFLRVVPDNTSALRLYRSAGFVDVTGAEADAWNREQPTTYIWLTLSPDQLPRVPGN